MRIAIVGGMVDSGSELGRLLVAEGHSVLEDGTCDESSLWIVQNGVHLVVLDATSLPWPALLDACRQVAQAPSTQLLVLGRGGDPGVGAWILEAGADDYIHQPRSPRDTLAQIHALLRRHPLAMSSLRSIRVLVTEELELDLAAQELVARSGRRIPLSHHEFSLLHCMVKHEGAVLGREALLSAAWGPEYLGADREVDVYIRFLRRKLEPDPARPRYLLTVRGVGYRFRGPNPRVAHKPAG